MMILYYTGKKVSLLIELLVGILLYFFSRNPVYSNQSPNMIVDFSFEHVKQLIKNMIMI